VYAYPQTRSRHPKIFIFGLVNDEVVADALHFRCFGRKDDRVATVLFVLGHNPKWREIITGISLQSIFSYCAHVIFWTQSVYVCLVHIQLIIFTAGLIKNLKPSE